MQVALPRTQDAAKLQEQMQQRGHQLNEQALERMRQEDIKKRKTVTENQQKDEAKLHNDEEQSNAREEQQRKKRKPNQTKPKKRHPYKGNRIDFSG